MTPESHILSITLLSCFLLLKVSATQEIHARFGTSSLGIPNHTNDTPTTTVTATPSPPSEQPPPPAQASLPSSIGEAPPTPPTSGTHHHHKPSNDTVFPLATEFTTSHNNLRAIYNVTSLTWDKTLVRYARRWANKRIDDCLLEHSPDSPYGENMFWSEKGHWSPLDVVRVWAGEYKYYDVKTNECIDDTVCGHYTQIVWKDTERLGCARVECNSNKGFLYVCSYDPPGNYYFEGPFGGRFNKSIVYPPPPDGGV